MTWLPTPLLLAQPLAIGYWVKVAIVVAGIIGIGLVAARAAGIAVPNWFVQIAWIVVAVIVAIVAINLILQLL